MKCFYALLFALLIAGMAPAQESAISPDTPVASSTLHEWLHSGDPRLVAWAADFARRNGDSAIIAEMPEWLEHSAMPSASGGDEWQAAHRRAVLAVLDALIQDNGRVPIPAIHAVSESFSPQAAILISRYPLKDAQEELYNWFAWGSPLLVRVAAMIFAKDPTHVLTSSHFDLTFVGGIVADAESELQIRIASDTAVRGWSWPGVACGDGGGHKLPPGWPQVYTYSLAENDSNANGPVVVDLGEDRIASWRHKENDGWGSCHGVQKLDSYTRHRLIAYWLGVKPHDMPWQPQQAITIRWTGKAAYERQLAQTVESQRQKLRATSDALRQRGVLEGLDAVPKLVVTIHCDIEPCPLQ